MDKMTNKIMPFSLPFRLGSPGARQVGAIRKGTSALYIHIPFCDHKCIYCDFYSIITTDNILPFLDSLKKEIKYYSDIYSGEKIFTSVYFGGGTPSLMQPDYIREIISTLKKYFVVSDDAEITLETNPGTVNGAKLKSFNEIGINRLSIGIQSFDEADLKFLTRIHNKKTAIETVFNAKESGFENINIDLIFNLPGQTKKKWVDNLQTALTLPVSHVSAYSLILERGTILNKMVLDGKVSIRDNDYDAELYEITIDFFESNGFHQYEVSNFALDGFDCLHNKAYWNYKEYMGFGPSAHSFVGGKRWWNFSSLKKYITEINKHNSAQAGYEVLSFEEMLNEYVMLAIRSNGLFINDFITRFGEEWINKKLNYFRKLCEKNLLLMDDNSIRLTKSGYALCDEILSNIL
jgi:oxygen-independent coproporphyrinogen-3 oxidase